MHFTRNELGFGLQHENLYHTSCASLSLCQMQQLCQPMAGLVEPVQCDKNANQCQILSFAQMRDFLSKAKATVLEPAQDLCVISLYERQPCRKRFYLCVPMLRVTLTLSDLYHLLHNGASAICVSLGLSDESQSNMCLDDGPLVPSSLTEFDPLLE